MKLSGWWKNRSSAGKVELYTRWSFHFFVVLEIVSVGLAALGSMTGKTAPALAITLLLTVCAQSVL
ncbi:sensor histidine kinase, partial [Streptomyces sp. NPDC059956]